MKINHFGIKLIKDTKYNSYDIIIFNLEKFHIHYFEIYNILNFNCTKNSYKFIKEYNLKFYIGGISNIQISKLISCNRKEKIKNLLKDNK